MDEFPICAKVDADPDPDDDDDDDDNGRGLLICLSCWAGRKREAVSDNNGKWAVLGGLWIVHWLVGWLYC